MAVYKSTRCYPFMNNIDIRIAQTNASSTYPVQFITCKVDTSNKNITGYSIRVLDEDNNQVFPKNKGEVKISPISELQTGNMAQYHEENGQNSGINGTYLKIPFFQNYNKKFVNTYNAIYYVPRFAVDYVITDSTEDLVRNNYPSDCRDFVNPLNWKILDNHNYVFDWERAGREDEQIYNKIYLDNELLLAGQTILVANDDGNGIPGGFYRVIKTLKESADNPNLKINETQLEPITTDDWSGGNITNCRVVLLKGTSLHNIVIFKNNDSYTFDYSNDFWCDILGPSTNLLDIHTGTSFYKWEITLYQGEGEVIDEDTEAPYVDYSELDDRSFDMVVTSGTILGSTTERIQIADNNGENPQLPGINNGTLVLQGKYMAFGNDSDYYSTDRAYVQSYDSTYGHAYPISGSVASGLISSSSKVRFYKHSLNPEDIYENEIVDFGVGAPIYFILYNNSTTVDEDTFDDLPVNSRFYGVSKYMLNQVAGGSLGDNIQEGQKILFTNVIKDPHSSINKGYMNGVYTVYLRSGISDTLFLKRDYSFYTWGAYIGKIIYVKTFYNQGGSIESTNIESLAGANPNYSLWNPDVPSLGLDAGKSYLYFSKEIPTLLFGNKIKDIDYVDLMWADSGVVSSLHPGDMIDGVVVKTGMKVIIKTLESQTYEWQLCEITSDGYQVIPEWSMVDTPCNVYVSEGQTKGKRVWKFTNYSYDINDPEEPTETWELHEATLLKNSDEYTFISPSLNVQKGMRLKLKGNNNVMFDGSSSLTQWIPILEYNNTIHRVKHPELISPTALVSENLEDKKTPWKYELRTFFKGSDCNPFYCYENPYIILYKNNSEYSSLSNLVSQEEYWVQGEVSGQEPFYVNGEEVSQTPEYLFIVGQYEDANVSYARLLKLAAKYVQGNGLSWESYRWILTDPKGNILQDTGKKYDKDMSVLFYGLSNDDIINYSVYYASVYIEDEIGNVIVYTIKLVIKAGEPLTSNFPFIAEYACEDHAVKLSYGGCSKLTASYRDSGGLYDSLYISNNFNFDKGIQYFDGSGFVTKNTGGVDDRPIDYSKGSTIQETDKDINYYTNHISLSNKVGVPYYTVFDNDEPLQAPSDNRALQMPAPEGRELDNGELYFETDISLNDNHCGQILEWIVEGRGEGLPVEPLSYYSTGETSSLAGYLRFQLFSEDNFTSPGININSNRNRLKIITTAYSDDGDENSESLMLTSLSLFNLPSKQYYYIQKATDTQLIDEDSEFLHYNLNKELYIKREKNTDTFFTSGNNDFGNLCLLTAQSKNASSYSKGITYWVEDRPFLISNIEASSSPNVYEFNKFLSNTPQNCVGQFVKGDRTLNTDENTKVLMWPGSDSEYSETDYYWDDDFMTNNSNLLPATWDNVTGSTKGVTKVSTIARHPGMSKNSWHIICRIMNIQSIYNNLIQGTLNITENQNIVEFGVGGLILGTISIQQNN